MFNNKIVNIVLIGIILIFIFKFLAKKSKKELNTNENFHFEEINNPNYSLKSILKKNKTKHNKRVRFSLIDDIKKEPRLNTTELCQKKEVDLSESFPEKLEEIKKCNKIKTNAELKDVYDDVVVDYKKNEEVKKILPVINLRRKAAFGQSSYNNIHWNYQNENIINGGNIVDNLYANDPYTDSIAKF